MKNLLFAVVSAIVLLVAAEANAHGGGTRVVVVDQFGNVISSRGGGFYGNSFNSRGFNFNFNQNGGRNRIGPRR